MPNTNWQFVHNETVWKIIVSIGTLWSQIKSYTNSYTYLNEYYNNTYASTKQGISSLKLVSNCEVFVNLSPVWVISLGIIAISLTSLRSTYIAITGGVISCEKIVL